MVLASLITSPQGPTSPGTTSGGHGTQLSPYPMKRQTQDPSSDLLLLVFLAGIGVVLLVLVVRRLAADSAGAGSWFGRRNQDRSLHLPPQPLIPPSPHERLYDEKYLGRILDSEDRPPRG